MDGPTFDQLARDPATTQTRRQLVRRAIGAPGLALGVGVPNENPLRSTRGEAAAACRAGGRICPGRAIAARTILSRRTALVASGAL